MKYLKSYIDWEKIQEGVADKYLKQKYGIPEPHEEFEEKYKKEILKSSGGEIAAYIESVRAIPLENPIPIYKNPPSLRGFPAWARGIITKSGDLYLSPQHMVFIPANEDYFVDEDMEVPIIHTEIAMALKDAGIIKIENLKYWDLKNPIEFLAVQRDGENPVIAVGESYGYETRRNRGEEEYRKEMEKYKKIFKPFIEAARIKNPNLEFTYNQVNYLKY